MSAIPRATLGDAIADIRLMAFYVAYDTLYENVSPPWKRFAMALVYSTLPVKDYALIRAWRDWTKGARTGSRSFGGLIESNVTPPPALAPIVEGYRRALQKQRHHHAEIPAMTFPTRE